MRTKLVTAATEPPITLSVLRQHVRLDDDDTTHDERLVDIAVQASGWTQDYINRALLTETYEYRLNGFPWCEIELPLAPVQSVTSVQYVDTAGSTQTWSSSLYNLDNHDDTGRAFIRPAYSEVFPVARDDYNSVTITYVTGWSDPSLIPPAIIRAILLIVGHFFENTEATAPVEIREVPFGVKALLSPHRNVRF